MITEHSAILNAIGVDEWLLRSENEPKPLIVDCTACSLASPASPPLFGVGSEQATLLVVAEYAVSASHVFSPKSGALFAAMMKAINLKAKHIFITNTIKCINSEKPTTEIAQTCGKHLLEQISEIKPKAILCLGSLAAQTLLNSEIKISQLRQSAHEIADIPVVVSYHPEYLLHQPSQKSATWQDLQLLAQFL